MYVVLKTLVVVSKFSTLLFVDNDLGEDIVFIFLHKPKYVEHDNAKHKSKSFLDEITHPVVLIGNYGPEKKYPKARDQKVA